MRSEETKDQINGTQPEVSRITTRLADKPRRLHNTITQNPTDLQAPHSQTQNTTQLQHLSLSQCEGEFLELSFAR